MGDVLLLRGSRRVAIVPNELAPIGTVALRAAGVPAVYRVDPASGRATVAPLTGATLYHVHASGSDAWAGTFAQRGDADAYAARLCRVHGGSWYVLRD